MLDLQPGQDGGDPHVVLNAADHHFAKPGIYRVEISVRHVSPEDSSLVEFGQTTAKVELRPDGELEMQNQFISTAGKPLPPEAGALRYYAFLTTADDVDVTSKDPDEWSILAHVDWGDGSSTDDPTIVKLGPRSFAFVNDHVYQKQGSPYTLKLTVRLGSDGEPITGTCRVVVLQAG